MQKFPSDVLKTWFQKTKRDLPWRVNPTPYAVWISEIMLQQTQVAVVKSYYERWMQRFPSIASLAVAPLSEVIKLWEGLGYYSRVRNIHEAAQFLLREYGGVFPSTREELIKVKGLGPYTIGAILSFAFQKKAAAVDGNVIRVLTRYFALQEDILQTEAKKQIWKIAEEILPEEKPWLVVEGLIELGAVVCKKDPKCFMCPLKEGCEAHHLGIERQLPKKEKKIPITHLKRNVFVIVHGSELLLKKEKEKKVMADLYEFPYTEEKEKAFPFSFAARKIQMLEEVEHSFTRFRVRLIPSLWKALERIPMADYDWIPWREVNQYPFSSGHRRILNCLGALDAYFTH